MILLLLLLMFIAVCVYGAGRDNIDRRTLPTFSLQRFMGRWYEIARFDHTFERGMSRVTADYVLSPDGAVEVVNSGMRGSRRFTLRGRAKMTRHRTIAGVVFLDILFRLQYSGDGPRRPMGFGGQPLAALSVDTRAHAVVARSRVGAYSVAGRRPRLRDAESHICRTVAAIAGRTDRYGCDAGRPWCGTTCRAAVLSRPDPRVRTLWS